MTIENMIMLANHTDFDTTLVLDEAKDGAIFRIFSDGKFAQALSGGGATGTWDGLEWEELEMWARLGDACDTGDVVVNAETREEFLVGGADENGDGSVLQVYCTRADLRDWEGGEGVQEGEYPLVSETGNEELYEAFWQKNAETGNPYRLDDFEYNGSFFIRL